MSRKTVYISLAIAIAFVFVWFFLVSRLLDLPIGRDEGGWTSITHEQYGFSVDYPTKWVAQTYGEYGFKGEDDAKLRIYRSVLGIFEITIHYQAISNPTLEDVVAWGHERIQKVQQNLINQGESVYEKMVSREDVINEHVVIRQTYRRENIMKEEVYIARMNDMIIISLQSEKTEFDSYVEDFNRIVNSFKPLE